MQVVTTLAEDGQKRHVANIEVAFKQCHFLLNPDSGLRIPLTQMGIAIRLSYIHFVCREAISQPQQIAHISPGPWPKNLIKPRSLGGPFALRPQLDFPKITQHTSHEVTMVTSHNPWSRSYGVGCPRYWVPEGGGI
jgi:hypothetical protein